MAYSKTQEVFNFIKAIASLGKTVTYQEIAQACNLPAVGNNMSAKISPILANIFLFCQLHELPYLTSIVVRKSGNEAGLPGIGFWKLLERVRPEAMYDAISSGSRARKTSVSNTMQNEVWRLAGTFTTSSVDLSLLDIADDEPDHLSLMVNEKIGAAVLRKPLVQVTREQTVDGTAPLSGTETDAALEQMRQLIAINFGVTLVHDHNGAYGPAGQRHLTLRFGDYTVSTVVTQVSSYDADTQQAAWEREDK
jgi:hypothetical protein